MELTKALHELTDQLKERGADHGTLLVIRQKIDAVDQEIDDKIKAALAGFTGGGGGVSQADFDALTQRVTALEGAIETGTGEPDLPISVSAGSLTGTVGQPVTGTASATGGNGGPYTFTAENLPGGISVSSDGVITGTPAEAGTGSFTMTAADSTGATGSTSVSFSFAS